MSDNDFLAIHEAKKTKIVDGNSFMERVGIKTALAFGVATVGVGAVAIVGSTFYNAASQPLIANKSARVITEDNQEDSNKLKTTAALAKQAASIKKGFGEPVAVKKPEKSEIKPAKPKIKPLKETKAVAIKPTFSAPKVQAVPVANPPAPPPPIEKTEIEPEAPTPAPIVVKPRPSPVSKDKEEEKNPFEVREQLAQAGIGVYGANTAISNTTPVTHTEKNQKPTTVLASYTYPKESQGYVTQEEPNLLAGDELQGQLKNTVVITGRTSQRPVIKVTKNFKDFSGKRLIPKKSRIVTNIHSINSQGVVKLLPTSVIINSQDKLVQKPIPQDSMLILAKNGQPLVAKTKFKKPPKLQQDRAREIVVTTVPVTRSKEASKTFKSKNLSRSRTNQILALRRSLKSSRNRPSNYRVFTLKKGTKVKVYVNKSFRL